MTKFEYVKIMSDSEIMKRNSYFRQLQERKEKESEKIIESNSMVLINAYHSYENNAIRYKNDMILDVDKEAEQWDNKKCICGKDMRFISSHGFWGCVDYKNESNNHSTFNYNHDDYLHNKKERIKVEICKDWATKIIRDNGFRNKLNAKQLLLFYQSEGLEDLREKYGYDNTIDSISSYQIAKEKSDAEEKEIKNFISTSFDRISSQFHIKYKVKGEREKLCKMDLIASDDKDVFLIEIKRNTMNVDDEQLSLYNDIIKCVMNTTGDTRELTPLFIISNLDGYDDPNEYFFFENFDDITDKSELKRIMKMFKHN